MEYLQEKQVWKIFCVRIVGSQSSGVSVAVSYKIRCAEVNNVLVKFKYLIIKNALIKNYLLSRGYSYIITHD